MTVMVMDREKIISLLKEMSDYFRECRSNASLGSNAENHFWELQIAAQDAATLLKEQEPKKRESRAMLPCKCGSVRYEHWFGTESEVLVCKRCGFKVIGRSNKDVIQKWNEQVK